jgi:hypothetical protein
MLPLNLTSKTTPQQAAAVTHAARLAAGDVPWPLHGGTPDEAIAAAADAARPDADGALGGVRRIRAAQARLIDTGGFLTTGAGAKWLPSGSRTKALLADMSTWTAEEVAAAPPMRALDGTNYNWNTLARVNAALRALVAQERAIIAAGNAAVTAFRAAQAAEQPFDFDAIAWPPVYTPPAPPPEPEPAEG